MRSLSKSSAGRSTSFSISQLVSITLIAVLASVCFQLQAHSSESKDMYHQRDTLQTQKNAAERGLAKALFQNSEANETIAKLKMENKNLKKSLADVSHVSGNTKRLRTLYEQITNQHDSVTNYAVTTKDLETAKVSLEQWQNFVALRTNADVQKSNTMIARIWNSLVQVNTKMDTMQDQCTSTCKEKPENNAANATNDTESGGEANTSNPLTAFEDTFWQILSWLWWALSLLLHGVVLASCAVVAALYAIWKWVYPKSYDTTSEDRMSHKDEAPDTRLSDDEWVKQVAQGLKAPKTTT
jgi:hypothetical protein